MATFLAITTCKIHLLLNYIKQTKLLVPLLLSYKAVLTAILRYRHDVVLIKLSLTSAQYYVVSAATWSDYFSCPILLFSHKGLSCFRVVWFFYSPVLHILPYICHQYSFIKYFSILTFFIIMLQVPLIAPCSYFQLSVT